MTSTAVFLAEMIEDCLAQLGDAIDGRLDGAGRLASPIHDRLQYLEACRIPAARLGMPSR